MILHSSDDRKASQVVRTYEATGEILGPIGSLCLAFRELFWSRHVIWHLFKRDFVASFRQKLLGYLWIVVAPLLGIASFVFMQSTGILNPGDIGIPYPIYVYIGTTVWGLLINSVTTVAGGLIANTDLIMRTNIPKIGLALTGMANLSYNLLVNLFVLLLIFAYFQIPPSSLALLYPLTVLPIVFLGVGLGLILAVVGTVARDVTVIFVTLLNLAMYVTPVVYTAQFSQPLLQKIVHWNPLTYLVDASRSLFVLGTVADPLAYGLAIIFAFFVLWLGIHSFYLIKDKVTERL
jgi:ABC-type polysaccharide/polyol phosphate export permease